MVNSQTKGKRMSTRVSMVTLLVDRYERVIVFYRDALGFRLVEDADLGNGKRWVVVEAPDGGRLLLAEASDTAQREAVGRQTGGRVGFFLETDGFERDYTAFVARGVHFL